MPSSQLPPAVSVSSWAIRIPSLNQVGAAGVQHIVLAMPHRGRLNLLTGLLQLPPASLFHKIKGGYEIPEELGAVGDVISHLGTIVPAFSSLSS
jgi:2-oxoglutarate dehydrogenase complex dehydrogenase (E1) component-like enzyme